MPTASARLTVDWKVSTEEVEAIVHALHDVMAAGRRQPGCLLCSLATELDERVSLHYIEEWRTEQDLAREVRSPRFVTLAELIEHASHVPRVRFQIAGKIHGLEYAEGIRAGGELP